MRLFTGGPGGKKGIPVHPLSYSTLNNYRISTVVKGKYLYTFLYLRHRMVLSISYISYMIVNPDTDMVIVMTN